MNDRIRELAEQNGFIHNWQPPGEQYEKLQTLEKFAEPEAEPVAWGVMKRGERVWYVNDSRSVCEGYASLYAHRDANGPDQSVVPLYTHPPSRAALAEQDQLRDATKMVGKPVAWRKRGGALTDDPYRAACWRDDDDADVTPLYTTPARGL